MPKNVASGNYFIGNLKLGHPEISAIAKTVRYPVRYTVLEWNNKPHGTALSTVAIEKKTLIYGDKELMGNLIY